MSLARAAVRIAAMEAIYGRTAAGENVSDSEIGVIDQVQSGSTDRPPFVVVYTDDTTMDIGGRDLLDHTAPVSLVFEIAVIASATGYDDDGNEQTANIVPQTDSQMELLLDLIERQVRLALVDLENDWANILDGLVADWGRIRSIRAAESKTTRFAARQLTLELTPIREPTPYGEPRGAWLEFITALEASDATMLQAHGAVFRKAFAEGAPVVGWREVAMRYGLGAEGAKAFGITPLEGSDDVEILSATADLNLLIGIHPNGADTRS